MKIKEGFFTREVAGNHIVVPIGETTIDFNGMMTLNESGRLLFDLMHDECTKEQLVEALVHEYGIQHTIAEKDVDRFIEKVKGAELFE